MGWQIVRHSLALLLRDWRGALRVSFGPLVLLMGVMGLAVPLLAHALLGNLTPESILGGAGAARLLVLQLLVVLGTCATVAWIAVAWHRHVLLGEPVTILPTPPRHLVWRYLGRFLLVALIPGILGLLVIFGVAFVASNSSAWPLRILSALAPIVWFVTVIHVMLRLGLVLPGTALARPLPLRAAWQITGRHRATLWALTGVLALAGVINNLLGHATSWPGTLLGFVVSWASLLLGLSILTTLYGQLVEERPLA